MMQDTIDSRFDKIGKGHCSRWAGIPQDDLNDDNRLHIGVLVKGMRTGPWNIRVRWDRVNWRYGLGTSFVLSHSHLATHDNDFLTRLVLAAHDDGCRVELSPCTPKAIRVSIWTRQGRNGSMGQRCATIETAIKNFRAERQSRRRSLWKQLTGK